MIKSTKKDIGVIIPKRNYQNYADCIRSDQVSAAEVNAIFEDDKKFYNWYKKKYLNEII